MATYEIVKGDLFTAQTSLAHCVSQDLRMGKGIATEFVKRWGRPKELYDQRYERLAVLKRQNEQGEWRYLYYMITKEKAWHKPSLKDFMKSLVLVLKHMIKNDVKHLSVPKLGAGLDGLSWDLIERALKKQFVEKHGINVTVYVL